ncbi:hypothetical protein ABK040_012543 [Willaertia magna]
MLEYPAHMLQAIHVNLLNKAIFKMGGSTFTRQVTFLKPTDEEKVIMLLVEEKTVAKRFRFFQFNNWKYVPEPKHWKQLVHRDPDTGVAMYVWKKESLEKLNIKYYPGIIKQEIESDAPFLESNAFGYSQTLLRKKAKTFAKNYSENRLYNLSLEDSGKPVYNKDLDEVTKEVSIRGIITGVIAGTPTYLPGSEINRIMEDAIQNVEPIDRNTIDIMQAAENQVRAKKNRKKN